MTPEWLEVGSVVLGFLQGPILRQLSRNAILLLAIGSVAPDRRANFVNDVGYLPDGTPMNLAGNAVNHPETIQARPRCSRRSLFAWSLDRKT